MKNLIVILLFILVSSSISKGKTIDTKLTHKSEGITLSKKFNNSNTFTLNNNSKTLVSKLYSKKHKNIFFSCATFPYRDSDGNPIGVMTLCCNSSGCISLITIQ